MTLTRVESKLSPELEQLVRAVIGACLAVHRELGPGMSESVYSKAVCIELTTRRIPFEREKSIPIRYRGQLLCHQRLDLFVDRRLVLEIKSVEQIHSVHVAQTVSYLRVTGAEIGLVINFNVPLLKHGIRRVVL
jgi:GxxExxY protein